MVMLSKERCIRTFNALDSFKLYYEELVSSKKKHGKLRHRTIKG
jgi:hypothetical protein